MIKSYSIDNINIIEENNVKYSTLDVNRTDFHKKTETIDYRLLYENGNWKIIRTNELEIKHDNEQSSLMRSKYLKLLLETDPFNEITLKLSKNLEFPKLWVDVDKFKGKKISTAGLEIEINNVITSKNGDEQFFEYKNNSSDSEDIIGLEMTFYNSNGGEISTVFMDISLIDNEKNIYSSRFHDNFSNRIIHSDINPYSKVDGLKVYFPVKKKNKPCVLKITGETALKKENSDVFAHIQGKEYYDGLINICND